MKVTILRPKVKGNWLYKDYSEDFRYFTDSVYNGDPDEWAECTNDEKEEWERQHQPIENQDNNN